MGIEIKHKGIADNTTTSPVEEAPRHKDNAAVENESTFKFNPAGIATKGFEAAAQTAVDVAEAFGKFKTDTSEAFQRVAGRFKDSSSPIAKETKIPEGLTAEQFSDAKVDGMMLALRRFKTMGELNMTNLLGMVADAEMLGIDTSSLTSQLASVMTEGQDDDNVA